MIRVGITGGRGFIASHIVNLLKDKRNASLSFFDLPENNLLEPNGALKKFVRNKDVIIHAAAVNRGSNVDIIGGSVVATHNLVSAMRKYKSTARLIFLSSIQVETETLYGQSKKLTEIMLKDFSKRYGIPVSIFRLTNVFGEGCRPFYNSVVATFCYQVANGQKITVHPESRNKKINLIYVKDAARMIIKEVFTKRKNLFYFKRVLSKNEIKVGELAKLIKSFKELKSPKKLKSKFYRDLYKTYLSCF
ncbi:NAD-dependent epimerase/dehydratase family protein [Candidatus Wolfebacteria bacterium]|nr:NAD-dependent epimerase/dehydratase family protein [Candidatus Wolfebacteria bacterium]